MSISTYHHNLMQMLGHHLCFGEVPTPRSPRFRRNPHSRPEVDRVVYPFDGRQKGVATRTFILGCVWVGHVNINNMIWAHLMTWFPPSHPKRGFPHRRALPSRGISAVSEAGHTSESRDVSKTSHHTLTHRIVHHLVFGLIPTLRGPRFRRNPPTVDRKSTVSSTPSTGVGRG